MHESQVSRQVLRLQEGFFNDGPWYVLSSTSLGGSGLDAQQMPQRLQTDDPETVRQLLRQGVCLPLFFDGDCALDGVRVILGDLTPQEEAEWVGRIQSRLAIPCGELLFLGGGGSEEDWESALAHWEPPEPDFVNFTKFKVAPGEYLVELYAFVGSMTLNVAWAGHGFTPQAAQTDESLSQWWDATRPGEPYPPWLESFRAEAMVPAEDLGLVEYLIRLRPWRAEDSQLALPPLVPEIHWCGVFEYRRSIPCPRGLPLDELDDE